MPKTNVPKLCLPDRFDDLAVCIFRFVGVIYCLVNGDLAGGEGGEGKSSRSIAIRIGSQCEDPAFFAECRVWSKNNLTLKINS